jgi:2-iminobutanoate/2-iminopropanoate deaminase
MNMKTKRRAVLKKIFASAVGVTGAGKLAEAENNKAAKAFTQFENLVFISGAGGHVAPFDIKNHTEICFRDCEASLKREGTSLDKVLKVQVWLNDIADFQGMNDVYKGRFGDKPPVRTTVAVAKGGVPSNSIVEIDMIAYK